MPTVLRDNGYQIIIYFNDHVPAHVHVRRAGGEVRIKIDCEPVELLNVLGQMSDREIRAACEIVDEHREFLAREWRSIHGG